MFFASSMPLFSVFAAFKKGVDDSELYALGLLEDGVRLYGFEAYQAGFSLMIAWTALAVVLLCFTRETHCRQME